MSLCKRLIARLDIKGNKLIKGIRFEGLRVLGDPVRRALDELQRSVRAAPRHGARGRERLLPVLHGVCGRGGIQLAGEAVATYPGERWDVRGEFLFLAVLFREGVG